MTISELKDKIRNSNQEEIAFFFKFDFDVDNSTIFDFIKLLRRDGFYR